MRREGIVLNADIAGEGSFQNFRLAGHVHLFAIGAEARCADGRNNDERYALGFGDILKLCLCGAGILNRIINGLDFIQGAFGLQALGEFVFDFIERRLFFRGDFRSLQKGGDKASGYGFADFVLLQFEGGLGNGLVQKLRL